MTETKLYIITREINEYDQDGEYFVAGFIQEPTTTQFADLGIDHLERKDFENEWFHLRILSEGELI
jgi:hypothetical protein